MLYPVLSEKTLPPVPRRLLLPARRSADDLPPVPPGGVYVFKVGGRQRLYGDRHIDLADDMVVNAVAVSVVQRRASMITCTFVIPSISAADDFTISATFRCQVLAPETVAESGLMDLSAVLYNHLAQDRDLKGLGQSYRIDDINEVRRLVDAQITAYCTLVPPAVRGMSIEFSSVLVHPSTELREQRRRVRDKEWEHEVGRIDVAWENGEINRYADLLSAGPAFAEALGMVRHEVNVGQVAERMREDERDRRRQLGETLQMMVDRGYFDRMPVDPMRLLDEVAGRRMGAGERPVLNDSGQTIPLGAGRASGRAGAGADRSEPDAIPSEEDIA
ncbi:MULTISPECIES: hypothetical protein [unclassified Micromonospora]|uniref:hypothetical protein n=1 Tax=unclassified Micromonospora TaxID=2617518 RepID=UPI001182A82C|nr:MULTISPECIES: hypothetical protein [unclassified Micromonospora]MDI5939698.1 hypothetical protein [Micromonospora sp. DH15]